MVRRELPTLPPVSGRSLEQMVKSWRLVEVLGDIADNEDGVLGSADLFDLYVPAWLCPEREVRGALENERALYRRLSDPELSTDERSAVAQAHAINRLQPWIPELRIASRVSPLRALAEHQHVAVVAAPGAGKSTMLRVVALSQLDPMFADPWCEGRAQALMLPVLLRLAEYAEALAGEPELELATFVARRAIYAEESLRAGQALLLLDGLDEVPTLEMRKRIARAIRVMLDATPGLRCVVTTRPNGAVHLPGIAVFHLDLFTEEMAIEFLARWRGCQRQARGVTIELAALRSEAAEFWEQLRKHPSLRTLARNPLLLAIVAVCQDMQVKLPHDRVQFYERALRTLLETWDHAREEEDESSVALETQWRAWGELALELRVESPAGIFRRELLVERLVAWLTAFGERETDSRRLAERVFDTALHRHGLLERRGGGDFMFWHPTFGEYLAATAIARDPDPQRLVALRDDRKNTEIAAMVLAQVATVQGDRRRANAWLAALAREDEMSWGPLVGSATSFTVDCVLRGCAADHAGIEALLGLIARRCVELPNGSWAVSFRRLVEAYPCFCPGPALIGALLPLCRTPRALGTAYARASAVRLLANVCATDRAADEACRAVAPTWRAGAELQGGRESAGLAALGLLRAGKSSPAWLPAITGLKWFRDGGDGLELSEDGSVLCAALRKMIPYLGERLADADPEVRHAAVLALALVDDARAMVVDELFAAEGGTVEWSLLARLARREAAVGERLVARALAAAEQGEGRDSSAGTCVARSLTAAGEHCGGLVRRLVEALSGELERPDGPAQTLLGRLVTDERPHLAGWIVAEAQARLLADPEATRLALRCVLLTGSGSPGTSAMELLLACVRRGDIDQRLVAFDQIEQTFHSSETAGREMIAAVEVELLCEALAHETGEKIAWTGWKVPSIISRKRPQTWGEVVEQFVRSIDDRLGPSPDERGPYVGPLGEALASEHDGIRGYAAVLLASVTTEDEARARLVPILIGLLGGGDRWLRVRAAAWLVDRRDELAAAADVTIGALQVALCSEVRRGFTDRIVRLGPPSDAVIHALMREQFPVYGIDPNWLFARIEVVDLIASYLGNEDNRLYRRSCSLLELGRGRDDVAERLYQRGLKAGPDEAAKLAAGLEMFERLDKPRDPRVTTLWRRALASTRPGVQTRAFRTVVWRCEPDEALREAALAVLGGESLRLRVLVAWDCVMVALGDGTLPVDVGACAAGLEAFGVSAERLLAALLPMVDEKEPLLRATAAVLLHVLGEHCEDVDRLLAPLRGLHAQFHENFNIWGPDWIQLAHMVVPPQFREFFDSTLDIGGWTLGVQAIGLGSSDETLPGRLLKELRAALAGADDFTKLRQARMLLLMMLASSPETAALGLNAVFSGLEAGGGDVPAGWQLVGYALEDDRVLARAVEHVLRGWPSAVSRQRELETLGASAEHRDRLRAAVRAFVQDDDPTIRGAAARWCVQLGEDESAVMAAWVECLFSESVTQVFPGLAWLSPAEAGRGVDYASAHPELWQGSPARTWRLLVLLEWSHPSLPAGAAAVVRAGLASLEPKNRRAAAVLCARLPGVVSAEEVAAIWRDALVEFDVGDDACTIAGRLLAAAPGDPVAIDTLRRIAGEADRHEACRACEALAACPSEHVFVCDRLRAWIEETERDSQTIGWALALLLRAGEPATAVARQALAALQSERLKAADLAAEGARTFHCDGPKGWPMARGMELAQQPTILDEALATELAECLGGDITVIGPRWQRLGEGGPCTADDIREVVTLLTVRADDDDRRLFARGYWYRRLPHDERHYLVLPPVERDDTPVRRLPADPQEREALLVERFVEPERLRRFVEGYWPEVADEIGWHGVSIRGAIGNLCRELSHRGLWRDFEARLFASPADRWVSGARTRALG